MKIEKIYACSELIDTRLTGITLLSVEEYEAAKEHIPPLDKWWWLRSPGDRSYAAALVYLDGSICADGDYVDYGYAVRPALRLDPESFNLLIGDKFLFGGKTWTYIAEGLALSNKMFCKMPFRKELETEDANVYEASDVKAYLDKWLKQLLAAETKSAASCPEKLNSSGGVKKLALENGTYRIAVGCYEQAPEVMRIKIWNTGDEEEITVLPDGFGVPESFLAYGCCFLKNIPDVLDALAEAGITKTTRPHHYGPDECDMDVLAGYDPEGVCMYHKKWEDATRAFSFAGRTHTDADTGKKDAGPAPARESAGSLTADEQQTVLAVFGRLTGMPETELFRIMDPLTAKKMRTLEHRLRRSAGK